MALICELMIGFAGQRKFDDLLMGNVMTPPKHRPSPGRPTETRAARDVFLRIDGMLMGVRGNLDGVAHYMKNNLSQGDYSEFIRPIGRAMAELIDLSESLHARFPDIVPKELIPPKQ